MDSAPSTPLVLQGDEDDVATPPQTARTQQRILARSRDDDPMTPPKSIGANNGANGSGRRLVHRSHLMDDSLDDIDDGLNDDADGDAILSRGRRMSVHGGLQLTSTAGAAAVAGRASIASPASPSFSSSSSSAAAAPMSSSLRMFNSPAHKATSAIAASTDENDEDDEESRAAESLKTVKGRLRACGLTEEIVDRERPVISREQIASIWSYHCDRSRAQALYPAEARPIAVWLFSRIPILFRQMVKRANPSKSKSEQDALVIEHLPHLLPGTSDEISFYFISSLPLNAEGRVTKDELVRCWNRHARLLFPSSHHKSSIKGTVYCTIL